MKSNFYYSNACRRIATGLKDILNSQENVLPPSVSNSPRAAGDALENLVSGSLCSLLGDWCKDFSSDFARRAMADLSFIDKEVVCSLVDVKTHRENTGFNMPNLTSVERLSRLYESDKDIFSIIILKYRIDKNHCIKVTDILFAPIEFFDWSCLTIGALGWGQIQISNSNNIHINQGYSRKDWMLEFCDRMEVFYPKEIEKIGERLQRFKDVRTYWENKNDIWK